MSNYQPHISNHLTLYSKGGASSWAFYHPTNTLFDIGEGFSAMGGPVFSMDRICISHTHWDHIGGLVGLVYARSSGKGSNEKPIDIYYPKRGEFEIQRLRGIIESNRSMRTPLNWYPIEPGHTIGLGGNQSLQAFPMQHGGVRALGYVHKEQRQKLTPEALTAIQDIPVHQRREFIKPHHYETQDHNVFAYCLDSYSFDPVHIKNANMVVFDGTFINPQDREDNTHMDWATIQALVKENNIKHPIVTHLSQRYDGHYVKEAIRRNPNLIVHTGNHIETVGINGQVQGRGR